MQGITGRVGEDDNAPRFAAHPKGAHVTGGDSYSFLACSKQGKIVAFANVVPVINQPWAVRKEKDPVPYDNGMIKSKGGRQTSGGQGSNAGGGTVNRMG